MTFPRTICRQTTQEERTRRDAALALPAVTSMSRIEEGRFGVGRGLVLRRVDEIRKKLEALNPNKSLVARFFRHSSFGFRISDLSFVIHT